MVLRLQSLQLRQCQYLSDESLRIIGATCPHLQSLWLNGCGKITDAPLVQMLNSVSALQLLGLSGCARKSVPYDTDRHHHHAYVYSLLFSMC